MITWSYVKQMKYDIIGVGGAKPAHGLRISCASAGSAHAVLSSVSHRLRNSNRIVPTVRNVSFLWNSWILCKNVENGSGSILMCNPGFVWKLQFLPFYLPETIHKPLVILAFGEGGPKRSTECGNTWNSLKCEEILDFVRF